MNCVLIFDDSERRSSESWIFHIAATWSLGVCASLPSFFRPDTTYIGREGGVRVCGDAVLRYFWCGFAVIFILTRGIAVLKH